MSRDMNRMVVSLGSMVRRIRSLLVDDRGVSAVEFALLLPLMLTLYLGAVEVTQGISANRKVTLTARTIGDLVAQVSTVSDADMTNSLNAAAAVMAPYPTTNLTVVVSSIKIDANGKPTIEWSDALNGTPHAKGSAVAVPTALLVPNTWLIWSEAQYLYTPTMGYVISGTLTLKDQIYLRPRVSDKVCRVSC